jgi:hypothetical protein
VSAHVFFSNRLAFSASLYSAAPLGGQNASTGRLLFCSHPGDHNVQSCYFARQHRAPIIGRMLQAVAEFHSALNNQEVPS